MKHIRHITLLLLTLTTSFSFIQAQSYVYAYIADGHYLSHCGNVTLAADQKVSAPTVFNPNTSLWSATAPAAATNLVAYGTESHNGGYVLKELAEGTYTHFSLIVSTASARNFQNVSTEPRCWPKSRLSGTYPGQYLRYHVTYGWILTETADTSIYGASTQPTVKALTSIDSYTDAPMLHISCPTVITADGTTPTLSASQSSKAYIHTVLNGSENHYWYDDDDHNAAPSSTPLSYSAPTWSLATADLEYADIDASTGAITVKKQIETDVTLTVSCSATVEGNIINATKNVTLKGEYYVLKDDTGRYMCLSGTNLGEGTTFNGSYNVWSSDVNGSGKSLSIKDGATTYYLSIANWSGPNSTPVEARVASTGTPGYNHRWFGVSPDFLKSAGNYYVYRDNDLWNLTSNEVDHRVVAYPVTLIEKRNSNLVNVTITGPSTPISSTGKYNFTASEPTSYANPYMVYVFQGETHYWYNSQDHDEAPEDWGVVNMAALTKIWSISKGSEYASIDSTTGELTVTTLPSTDTNLTLTYTISDGTHTLTTTKDVNISIVEELIYSLDDITSVTGSYKLASTFSTTGTAIDADSGLSIGTSSNPFKGTIDGRLVPITGTWDKPLFDYVENATIKNVIIKGNNSIGSNNNNNVGAMAGTAKGHSRIYNCGILPMTTVKNANGKITGFTGTTVSGSAGVGSIVGQLDGTLNADGYPHVINCFSYATVSGGNYVAGIVGDCSYGSSTQGWDNSDPTQNKLRTVVVNCMFYGEITSGTSIAPVFGNKSIANSANGINLYDYFWEGASFDNSFNNISQYKLSWPAIDEYLTRFEYYRNILNSNRRLCTFWVTDKTGTQQTDDDLKLIAKWVLDPEMAPFPILKRWSKYPSVINPDPTRVWNPNTEQWVNRATAPDYCGKQIGKPLSVTVNAGTHHAGSKSTSILLSLPITDMDTLNCDYSYAKVQLPYYNDLFGDPTSGDSTDAEHQNRYGGNYTDYVVTGWKITTILGGTPGTFDGSSSRAWESGYNFADRQCTNKDLHAKSGRVFAQGGFFYVPENVQSITIEAYWGKALYLHNAGHNIDRVNVTNGTVSATTFDATKGVGDAFAPAGTLPDTYHGHTVYTSLHTAIRALDAETTAPTVYDQAIVLLSNLQLQNRSQPVGTDLTGGVYKPFTLMSADLDIDNEPDNCFQWQMRDNFQRRGIQPIRFDFLSVPELGLAIRHNERAYAIGIVVPQGHFEITETSCMHTTQFEYDAGSGTTDNANCGPKKAAPIILNGGHFEQIVVRYGPQNKTTYFLMGGHFRMKRFTPGAHASSTAKVRLCAVNCIGGEFPEFYLSGIYRADVAPTSASSQGNPHCYTNGGKFGLMAGAGYEKILGNVTFKIDHSIIREFYGGGINAAKPVGGNINVTINNSLVTEKYCGGPKVGPMADGKTVTTNANGTTFYKFFGGGNGGNSVYRLKHTDNDTAWPAENASGWNSRGFSTFNPLKRYVTDEAEGDLGYDALFEFEVFNSSNGINNQAVIRTYFNLMEFGTTTTGNVTNTLTGCTILTNFYGGGNLGKVTGNVTSTLTDTRVVNSVFGGGFSAEIPRFRVHDKNSTKFPKRDYTGTIVEQGSLDYVKDNGQDRWYRWTNDDNGGTATRTNPAYYSEADGEWKCYTQVPLVGLGEVSGNVTLTINGNTVINESAYGGGEESAVGGDTYVIVNGGTIGLSGKGGSVWGNVYGGGRGKEDDVQAGLIRGNTNVTINGTTETTKILHNVYGGGAVGSVGTFTRDAVTGYPTTCADGTGLATVTINGGIIGHQRRDTGMVNGSSRGAEGDPNASGSLLNQLAWINNSNVIIGASAASDEDTGPSVLGSVYGGGENGHNLENSVVTINRGTIGNATATWDCGSVYGAGCGTDTYTVGDDPTKHHNPMAGIVLGTSLVTLNGGHVIRNVYGGGSMGSVGGNTLVANSGKATVNINGGTVGIDGTAYGHVYGGPKGNLTETAYFSTVEESAVTIGGTANILGSVFGGGEAGIIERSVVVNMTGGEVHQDLYGGGALASTNTTSTALGGEAAALTTVVNLTGGKIGGNAYGGGLGRKAVAAQAAVGTEGDPDYVPAVEAVEAVEALVGGEVTVNVNGSRIGGNVFGCNNKNGTPKKDVTVYVMQTVPYTGDISPKHERFDMDNYNEADEATHPYDLAAVYGGGNEAAYVPAVPMTNICRVIINACQEASIRYVYGGGNAAPVPQCEVEMQGAYEVGYVFAGGNGRDAMSDGSENPGADVGVIDQAAYQASKAASTPLASRAGRYGTGNATAYIYGGTIHHVFGGSNTKGNIVGTSTVQLGDENDLCPISGLDDIFAFGNEAVQDGPARLDIRCLTSKINAIYGGAKRANVDSDVLLNIYSGRFGHVFGGNKESGSINGTITVNVEERGCNPIIIDELYGGGNQAAYTAPAGAGGLRNGPFVNVRSCTSIGTIFGGGYGANAAITGNPQVNINMDTGYTTTDPTDTDASQRTARPLGTIGTVFGGGNAASVTGNTTVAVGTEGKSAQITGNIFGGGNEAEVHGNTNVVIGQRQQ